jgi:hypothetical protein
MAGSAERITMSEAKSRLIAKLNDDTALDNFLILMGRLIRGDETRAGPGSQEEAEYFDSREELRDTIEREVHPTVLEPENRDFCSLLTAKIHKLNRL